jgi:hypothetical protein
MALQTLPAPSTKVLLCDDCGAVVLVLTSAAAQLVEIRAKCRCGATVGYGEDDGD